MGYLLEDLPSAKQIAYFIGLDLGQSQDFSAMAILERHGTSKHDYIFHCRHLHRWKLRTSYPAIVAESVAIANDPKLRTRDRQPMLAVDATGVGAPVIDCELMPEGELGQVEAQKKSLDSVKLDSPKD